MPEFEINTNDRRAVEEILEFVRRSLAELPMPARMMFVVETLRQMKPEIDELKRNSQKASHA